MSRQLTVLTNSSITTAHRCFREYKYRYVDLMKGRGRNVALEFGSLFHLGLNEWWRCTGPESLSADAWARAVALDPEIRLQAALHAVRQPSKHDARVDPFELVKAESLLAGYTARWGGEGYETLAVEKRFALPLDGGELRGSIDAIARKGDRVYNIEHKTTSSDISPGSPYWHHVVALDSQVSTYDAASRAMGYDVRGTLYDVIRKPEFAPMKATPEESRKYTKPTKAEPVPRLYANQRETDETPEEFRDRLVEDIIARPDWYFQRQTIVRLDHDNEEHARDVAQTAQMIANATERNAWPRSPKACERYRRWCSYHPVCSGEASLTDGTLYEKKTSQHEELE